MTFETLAEFLALVQELHLFYVSEVSAVTTQRIQGLALFTVSVGAVIAFFASHPVKTPALKWACALVLSCATLAILVFQLHWTYAAHRTEQWAKEYQNEMEQVAHRMSSLALTPTSQFDNLTPFTGQSEDCAASSGCWRKRKAKEIDRDWCHAPNLIGTNRQLKCVNGLHEDDRFILASSRQSNVWTYCIIGFWLAGMIYLFAATAYATKTQEKPQPRSRARAERPTSAPE